MCLLPVCFYSKTDESLEESDEHLKQLISNAKNLPDLTGASKRTIYLLKKVMCLPSSLSFPSQH